MTAGQTGTIRVSFVDGVLYSTKASAVPDTNDFLLSVTDSKGAVLYEGVFGAAPESIAAAPGTYTVSARSGEFDQPRYDAPQYGDIQTVVVSPGKTSDVHLKCTLMNCGVRLYPDYDFLYEYPQGEFYLKGADGMLMCGYSEKRVAYFKPGTIAVSLKSGGQERLLCTREVAAREVLHLAISAAAGSGGTGGSGDIDIQVDTTSVHTGDDYVIPVSGGGNDISTAYSVAEAKKHIGEDDVWVYGYIVGGDLSSSKCSFSAPFTSRTNMVLGPKSSTADKASCLSIQLSSGDMRNELNLVDNPGLLGRQIYLKGHIVESYYSIPGLQNISEYRWK